ncbi:MAG: prepilin-type N-terminal cleavage/methylation domain-containing protein, partial [Pseudomonadota bacterium]
MRRPVVPGVSPANVSFAGFTLVELVVVMVVLAILSVGTVRFIGDSSAGFADTVTRDRLASTARFALAELHASVKDALPGSPRTNGQCLEVIPVVSATQYFHIPTGSPAASFPALSPPVLPGAGARAAVAPVADVYALNAVGVISPQIAVSAPDGNNAVTV